MITVIRNGTTIATTKDEISKEVDNYFSNMFGTAPRRGHPINLDSLQWTTRDLSHLEAPFTEEEVERVVKKMPLNKAPGPDGFTVRFYSSSWHIIKGNLMRALQDFYDGDMRGMPAVWVKTGGSRVGGPELCV